MALFYELLFKCTVFMIVGACDVFKLQSLFNLFINIIHLGNFLEKRTQDH